MINAEGYIIKDSASKCDSIGRFTIAGSKHNLGDKIFQCDSLAIANLDVTCCYRCGFPSKEMSCPGCEASFCRECEVNEHVTSGECAVISQYSRLHEDDIPIQALLAYRILRGKHPQQDVSCLVGSAIDCDETRQDIASALSAAIISCQNDFPSLQNNFGKQDILHTLGVIRRNAFKFGKGIALFPVAAMMNHSCSPSAIMTIEYGDHHDSATTMTSTSRKLVATVRAIRAIRQNEEISISYIPLALNPSYLRREAIYNSHNFICACYSCSSSSDTIDSELRKQGVTAIGDVMVGTEVLESLLAMVEDELSAIDTSAGATGDVCRKSFPSCHMLLNRAMAGMRNLQLGPHHYLWFNYYGQLTELAVLEGMASSVSYYTSKWLRKFRELPPDIQVLCDVHLKCRMNVLYGESVADKCEMSCHVYEADEFRSKAMEALDDACSIASYIHGPNYILLDLLKKRKVRIAGLQSKATKRHCQRTTFTVHNLADGLCKPDKSPDNATMKLIRLVGYASGLRYTDDDTLYTSEELIRQVISEVYGDADDDDGGRVCSNAPYKEAPPCSLIFDGDNFATDSFTYILPEIHRQLPSMSIWATVMTEGDIDRLQKSWEWTGVKEIHVAVTAASSYRDHAITSHFLSNPSGVYCLGGGQCVLDEYQAVQAAVEKNQTETDAESVPFYLYDAARWSEAKKDIEHSLLLSFVEPSA